MRKFLLGALAAASIFQACGEKTTANGSKQGVVFPSVTYSKAVAYHYEGNDGKYIVEKGQLNGHVYKEQELSKTQIDQFLGMMNNPDSYGGTPTRCFKPHLGVVFYDAQGKAVAHSSICFMCNNQYSSPAIQAEKQSAQNGFSEEGRRQLIEFCKGLSFGQCGDEPTTNDDTE